MEPTPTDAVFEALARDFLAKHPEVEHEWRQSKKWFFRWTSIVCGAGRPNEVWASFNRGGQIAVGSTADDDHKDFEDFGRGLSDEELGREAFAFFVELLREYGHVSEAP